MEVKFLFPFELNSLNLLKYYQIKALINLFLLIHFVIFLKNIFFHILQPIKTTFQILIFNFDPYLIVLTKVFLTHHI
jgi:hypothetical protein